MPAAIEYGDEGYELWDLVSGNVNSEFPTEAEALAFVRRAVQQFGREHVHGWGLTRPGADAASIEGAALIDLALQPAKPSTTG